MFTSLPFDELEHGALQHVMQNIGTSLREKGE